MELQQFLALTELELCEMVTQRLLNDNPHLKLGDTMTHPVQIAYDGKILKDFLDDTRPVTPITARSIKISIKDLNGASPFKLDSILGTYLHPYMAKSVNVDFISKYKVGDTVEMIDPTTYADKEVIVTQEMMDNYSCFMYRFAIAEASAAQDLI